VPSYRAVTTRPSAGGSALRASRVLIAVLGIVSFAAGVIAVFSLTTTTGAVVLLVIGAALFTIAALGLSPREVKFGANEVRFEEVVYAERTREAIEEVISGKEATEDRESLAGLIVRMNEQFGEQVGVVPDSAKKLAMEAYMVAVSGALRRIVPRDCAIDELDESNDLDYRVSGRGGGEVYVDCSLGIESTGGPMPVEIIKYYMEKSGTVRRLLVVSNRPPVDGVWQEAQNRGFKAWSRVSITPRLEFVRWTSPTEDDALRLAMDKMRKNDEL
jgi:hypothetical protein